MTTIPAKPDTMNLNHVVTWIGHLEVAKILPMLRVVAALTVIGPTFVVSGAEAGRSEAKSAAAPDFGPNVLIFDPSMANIQSRLDAVFGQQERTQFGTNRYAYLFKPGKYDLDVQVGFYTQVLGLGTSPDDVAITGGV